MMGLKSVKRTDNQPVYDGNYEHRPHPNAKSHEMHITSFGSNSHMEKYQSAEIKENHAK